jgi:hypothetical protein
MHVILQTVSNAFSKPQTAIHSMYVNKYFRLPESRDFGVPPSNQCAYRKGALFKNVIASLNFDFVTDG